MLLSPLFLSSISYINEYYGQLWKCVSEQYSHNNCSMDECSPEKLSWCCNETVCHGFEWSNGLDTVLPIKVLYIAGVRSDGVELWAVHVACDTVDHLSQESPVTTDHGKSDERPTTRTGLSKFTSLFYHSNLLLLPFHLVPIFIWGRCLMIHAFM